VAAFALWVALAPWTAWLVARGAAAVLALGGAHGAPPAEPAASANAVLFTALYLGHRPGWRRARVALPLGVAACLASDALEAAAFTAFPSDATAGERLARGFAFALERVTPLLAWLAAAQPHLGRSGAGSRSPRTGRRA
jgi:hypothetical protein